MRPTVSAQRVFEINIMATEKRRVRLKRINALRSGDTINIEWLFFMTIFINEL